ncbi:hypothetical protein PTI98_004635 [Pleurotus ostreatus]|nr:hypothetical protein PTI98_004635 [Pleurotus ostreatus]
MLYLRYYLIAYHPSCIKSHFKKGDVQRRQKLSNFTTACTAKIMTGDTCCGEWQSVQTTKRIVQQRAGGCHGSNIKTWVVSHDIYRL